MSFQSFVTERLAVITAQLNAIGRNAKKIDELPVQSTLSPVSKIHVSRGGVSESLEVQKIIDSIKNNTYNQLISIGTITTLNNEVSIPADARWQINGIGYNTIAVTKIPMPYSAVGTTRTDIIVANILSKIVRIAGAETAGIAVRPNIPVDSVLVTEINVSNTVISDFITPVIGDAFANKLDKDGYTGTAKTLDNRILDLELPDGVINIGLIAQIGSSVTIAANEFSVRNNQIEVFNTAFSGTIASATDLYIRTDIYEIDTNGIIYIHQGDQDLEIAKKPDVTVGRYEIGLVNINGAIVSPATTVAAGDAYIAKSEATFKKLSGSGYKAAFSITDEVTNFLVVAATSLGSISVSTANKKFIYDGKDHYLKNANGGVLQVLHLSGTGNFKYSFPNAETLSIKNNEMAHFKWRFDAGNSGFLDYVGIVYDKTRIGLGNVDNTSDLNKPVSTAQADALALKLNSSDYNNRFKGVYLTQAALISAHPTAIVGDYAQVNEVGATDVVNYNWDAEENIWVKNIVAGSGATNTDQLPEGTSNLYFTVSRFLANLTTANIKAALGITTLSGSNTGDETTASLKTKIDVELAYACSDETSNLTVGNLISFRVPFAMILSSIRISVNDAPTLSSLVVDVKEGGISIFSTLLSIDASELTSVTAASVAVISDINLADDALITVNTTQIGSGNTGKGLKILFKGKKA